MSGGRKLRLLEVGPAHTPGDLFIHVPDAGVVYTGDILFVGATPIMWAGPVVNWVVAIDRLLDLDADTYVPGHGPVCGREEAEAVKRYWVWLEAAARHRFGLGMSAWEAARDIALSPEFKTYEWSEWGQPERIVVNVHTLERERRGRARRRGVPARAGHALLPRGAARRGARSADPETQRGRHKAGPASNCTFATRSIGRERRDLLVVRRMGRLDHQRPLADGGHQPRRCPSRVVVRSALTLTVWIAVTDVEREPVERVRRTRLVERTDGRVLVVEVRDLALLRSDRRTSRDRHRLRLRRCDRDRLAVDLDPDVDGAPGLRQVVAGGRQLGRDRRTPSVTTEDQVSSCSKLRICSERSVTASPGAATSACRARRRHLVGGRACRAGEVDRRAQPIPPLRQSLPAVSSACIPLPFEIACAVPPRNAAAPAGLA